ncbi:MAG: DUF4244 domain-containing protein [Acidimicrobiales bacterium]
MLYLVLVIQSLLHHCNPRRHAIALRRDDRGQTTAEYALVLLGAASVALILVAWAAKSGKIAELFDAVIDSIVGKL